MMHDHQPGDDEAMDKAVHGRHVDHTLAGAAMYPPKPAAGVLAPLGIILSPAVGAIFMSLSTVIVALNAQLLRGLKLGAGSTV